MIDHRENGDEKGSLSGLVANALNSDTVSIDDEEAADVDPEEPLPRKRGGGRPRGTTKEKLLERANLKQSVQGPQQGSRAQQALLPQHYHPYRHPEADPYLVDPQYLYSRDQQAAHQAAYHYRPPPPSSLEGYPPYEYMGRSLPPGYRNAPLERLPPDYYGGGGLHHENNNDLDWRVSAPLPTHPSIK
jgi:hypothetical protein